VGVRAVEEAEGGLEDTFRKPPCGDVTDGEEVRDARRAWVRRSSPKGSGGGKGSTGRGGKMGPRPWGSLGERAAEGGWR
jgi:hypothetical protein